MLLPGKIKGQIEQILINSDREKTLETVSRNEVVVGFTGFSGDSHSGLTRLSCSRTKRQYPVGTEIRNTRQLSIVSLEELQKISMRMQIEELKPEWVGANLLISGIPNLSLLPPSTRLVFAGGVSLVVDMENYPCKYPGEVIDRFFPGKGCAFPKAAQHLRGVTAWVEKPGELHRREKVVPHFPKQKAYPDL